MRRAAALPCAAAAALIVIVCACCPLAVVSQAELQVSRKQLAVAGGDVLGY